MLSYRRPGDTKWEDAFVEEFCMDLPDAWQDGYGNVHVEVGTGSETLFSCHTDTVHRAGGTQNVLYDQNTAHAFIDNVKQPSANCLGADDGAGVWIMREMILASKKGYYIFHRDEETGGQGSAWIAKNMEKEMRKFKRAIAFDRKGTEDIITRQRGGQCCSFSFATELGKQLTEVGIPNMKSDTGSFTDTANYIHLIQECTNLSVGYYYQHGPRETLDVKFLDRLRKAAIKLDWEALPTTRVAKKNQEHVYSGRPATVPQKPPPKKDEGIKLEDKLKGLSQSDKEWWQTQLNVQLDQRLAYHELIESPDTDSLENDGSKSTTAEEDDLDDDDSETIANAEDVMWFVFKHPHAACQLLAYMDITYEDIQAFKSESKEHLRDTMGGTKRAKT